MAIIVNLSSKKEGEIKRFLERYYQKDIDMDKDVEQWIYVYNKPLDAIDIMSAVIDNTHQYEITLCMQIDRSEVHTVTVENHNDIIKGILCLFYKETPEVSQGTIL